MADTSKKQNLTTIIQIIILLVLCAGAVGLAYAFGVFTPSKEYRSVTLRAENSAGTVQLIYSIPGESSKDPMKVSTPWEKSFSIKVGSEIYISVGNAVQNGTVKCSILIDGKAWKKDSATYPADKVSCAGILPPQ
jgi:hypothetical protein